MRLFKAIAVICCLFAIVLHVGFYITEHLGLYATQFQPKFFEDAYGQSQYVRVDPIQNIPDEYAYALASWMYTHGENPALFNADQPPLGKYIVGWGEIVFGNEKIMTPIFFVLTLTAFLGLAHLVIGDILLASFATLAFSYEKLLLVQTIFAPLLDIFQLFFILLSLIFGVLSIKSRWWLIPTMIAIGCVAGTKFFITAMVILMTLFIYYVIRLVGQWKNLNYSSSVVEKSFLKSRSKGRVSSRQARTVSTVIPNWFWNDIRRGTLKGMLKQALSAGRQVQHDKSLKDFLFFLLSVHLSLITLLLIYFPAYHHGYSPRMILGVQNYIYHFHAEKMHFSLVNVWQLLLFNRWYVPWEFKIKPSVDWQFTWPIVTIGAFALIVLSLRGAQRRGNLTPLWAGLVGRLPRFARNDRRVEMIMLWVVVYGVFLMFGNVLTRYLLPLLPGLYILTFVLIKKILVHLRD